MMWNAMQSLMAPVHDISHDSQVNWSQVKVCVVFWLKLVVEVASLPQCQLHWQRDSVWDQDHHLVSFLNSDSLRSLLAINPSDPNSNFESISYYMPLLMGPPQGSFSIFVGFLIRASSSEIPSRQVLLGTAAACLLRRGVVRRAVEGTAPPLRRRRRKAPGGNKTRRRLARERKSRFQAALSMVVVKNSRW